MHNGKFRKLCRVVTERNNAVSRLETLVGPAILWLRPQSGGIAEWGVLVAGVDLRLHLHHPARIDLPLCGILNVLQALAAAVPGGCLRSEEVRTRSSFYVLAKVRRPRHCLRMYGFVSTPGSIQNFQQPPVCNSKPFMWVCGDTQPMCPCGICDSHILKHRGRV